MMMGFGCYGNGGGSSSSSSNLSALAPPFTVDRPVSKPLVDLSEPPLNWLNTHPLSFDSMHSSNAYGYSFNPPSAAHMPPPENAISITSTDSSLYGQNAKLTTNLVEAKPYYPSYVSPTKCTYDDYAQSLSGLWDGSRGWELGKKVEHGESFCSKAMDVPDLSIYQGYTGQGAHSSMRLNTCEQSTKNIDMLASQQFQGSTNREPLEYKSYSGKISDFRPVEYSGKSVLGSTSLFPETYSLTSCEQGRSNHQTPYGASFDKGVKQHSVSPNDISSVMKSSPGLVIRSQDVGSGPSAPNTSSFNNLENCSDANNMDFSSIDISKMKEFHPLQSSEGNVNSDASQLNFHLGGCIHSIQELPLGKKEKLFSNVNVINDPFWEKSGLQIPDIGPGCFSLMPASNGALNCLEGSSESLDHYNPAVDSPCWKGASVYHFSPLENSGPVTLSLIKKIEGVSNSTGPTDTSVKFSCDKPRNYSLYQKNSSLENDSESSPKRPSFANLLFEEHGNDHDLKAGSYHMKSTCGLSVQLSEYKHRPIQDSVFANNSVDEYKLKSFHSMQQNSIEDELTFDKNCESGTDVADVGMNTHNVSEGCSSHVPLHATEHVLSSPSSVEAAPPNLTKLRGEEFAPQICVETLLSTMHNLSELLLFHCSNGECELKENDIEALKQVVNNLDKCIYHTMGPEAPLQESLLSQKSTLIREVPERHEVETVSRPWETQVPFSFLNQSNYQHVQEERIRHTMSDKKDEKCSDFTSQGGDAERVKDDNMTKALKEVLSENFVEEEDEKIQLLLYKNLWLEAEAALCSINYKARFDRMKIELEKHKLLKAKDLSENATELKVKKLSQSAFYPDQNAINKLPPEDKDNLTQDVLVQDFPVANTSSHPEDVIARFHILKCQESNSNGRTTTDLDKLSSYNKTPHLDKVDKMAFEDINNRTPYISTCGLPNSSSTGDADDIETWVMARFNILKSRIEKSSCVNMDQLLPQVDDLGCAGEGKNMREDGTLAGNKEPVLQQNSANHTQAELTLKDLHVKHDPMIESPWMNRPVNQLPACSYDSSSSDWEHVSKEDLPAQNC